jgi:hypothetical protein
MPQGRPAKLSDRLAVVVPVYQKAAAMEAARLCRTDVGSLLALAFAQLANPAGEDISNEVLSERLGQRLAQLALERLDHERSLAVRGQDQLATV